MKLLIRYLTPLKKDVIKSVSLKFIGAFLTLVLPYILAYMIDSVVPTKNLTYILLYGFLMVILAFISWRADVNANRQASKVARDATYSIRNDLFNKTIHLSSKTFDTFTIPSLESRLTSDTYNVHHMTGMLQRMAIRAPILLIGGIILTMMMEPYLSFVMMCTLPFIGVLVYFRATKGIVYYSKAQSAQDDMIRVVRENTQGVRIIKALSKHDDERKRFDEVNMNLAEKEKYASKRMAIINPLLNLFMNIGMVGVILVGAYRVNLGLSETGKIIAFTNYFVLISNAMMAISRIFIMTSKGIASSNRILEVLDTKEESKQSNNKFKETDNIIELENVSFSYLGKYNNLENISFELKENQTLGVLGVTGSGKSTLLQVLLGLYDIDQGNIYIKGKNIKEYKLDELKEMFGVVMQNDFIFAGTLQENIDFYRNIEDEQLNQAIINAQGNFIFDLDEKLNSKITTRGTNFSGGQRQRICLSRAFASNPEILILDDSSSALDYATDANLRKAIALNMKQSTKIIIAQRISSIAHADKIIVLNEGKIDAIGTHEQLLEECETYQSIAASQMGGALLE